MISVWRNDLNFGSDSVTDTQGSVAGGVGFFLYFFLGGGKGGRGRGGIKVVWANATAFNGSDVPRKHVDSVLHRKYSLWERGGGVAGMFINC